MTTNKEPETNIFNNLKIDPEFIIRKCTLEDLDKVIEINEKE